MKISIQIFKKRKYFLLLKSANTPCLGFKSLYQIKRWDSSKYIRKYHFIISVSLFCILKLDLDVINQNHNILCEKSTLDRMKVFLIFISLCDCTTNKIFIKESFNV